MPYAELSQVDLRKIFWEVSIKHYLPLPSKHEYLKLKYLMGFLILTCVHWIGRTQLCLCSCVHCSCFTKTVEVLLSYVENHSKNFLTTFLYFLSRRPKIQFSHSHCYSGRCELGRQHTLLRKGCLRLVLCRFLRCPTQTAFSGNQGSQINF